MTVSTGFKQQLYLKGEFANGKKTIHMALFAGGTGSGNHSLRCICAGSKCNHYEFPEL
jgi:hypothetical protein